MYRLSPINEGISDFHVENETTAASSSAANFQSDSFTAGARTNRKKKRRNNRVTMVAENPVTVIDETSVRQNDMDKLNNFVDFENETLSNALYRERTPSPEEKHASLPPKPTSPPHQSESGRFLKPPTPADNSIYVISDGNNSRSRSTSSQVAAVDSVEPSTSTGIKQQRQTSFSESVVILGETTTKPKHSRINKPAWASTDMNEITTVNSKATPPAGILRNASRPDTGDLKREPTALTMYDDEEASPGPRLKPATPVAERPQSAKKTKKTKKKKKKKKKKRKTLADQCCTIL
jgi:hypothetical protein